MDEIEAMLNKIDAYLPSTATREIVSTQEVQDLLLDLRISLLAVRLAVQPTYSATLA